MCYISHCNSSPQVWPSHTWQSLDVLDLSIHQNMLICVSLKVESMMYCKIDNSIATLITSNECMSYSDISVCKPLTVFSNDSPQSDEELEKEILCLNRSILGLLQNR